MKQLTLNLYGINNQQIIKVFHSEKEIDQPHHLIDRVGLFRLVGM